MALTAAPTSRSVKKLSDIPEEPSTSVLSPPLRRARPLPSPPKTSLQTASPKLNFHDNEGELYEEAKRLYGAGMQWLKQGKSGVKDAEESFRRSYELFVDLDRFDKAMKALGQLSWCTATLAHRSAKAQDFDAALRGYEEARALYKALAESSNSVKAGSARSKEAMALFQYGVVSAEVKDLVGATAALKEASQLFTLIRQDSEEAMCFCELANMLARRDSASALHFLRQSLLIFCRLGDSHKEAHCLYEIGRLAASRARDFATAFSYFLQARVIFRQRGDITEDANCSYELGKLAAKARQLSAAVSYFEEASDLYHTTSRPVDEGWCYYRIALVLLKLDASETDPTRADLPVDYLTEARALFRDAGDRDAEGSALMRLGDVLREVDPDAAKEYLEEALELLDSEKDARTRRTTAVLQELEGREKPNIRPAKAWWTAE